MRDRCGSIVASQGPCGVSSCKVDKAVVLLANPSCDKCVGGSCCKEINACYQDRRCKLALECIVSRCASTLGEAMSRLTAAGKAEIERTRAAVCSGASAERPQPGTDAGADMSGDPTRCIVDECLEVFAPVSGGTSDDQNARCLAFGVFSCGALADCGKSCAADEDASAERDAAPGGSTDAGR
jgi:hypothetical protein